MKYPFYTFKLLGPPYKSFILAFTTERIVCVHMYSLAKIWMPTKVGKYENTRKLMRRIEIERTFARCWCRQAQTVETVRWEVVTEFGPGAVEPSPTWFAVTVANRRWYSALTLTFLLGTKSWLCFCVRPSLDDVFAGWQNKRRGFCFTRIECWWIVRFSGATAEWSGFVDVAVVK